MAGGRRTRASASSEADGREKQLVVKEGTSEDPVVIPEETHLESEVAKLRERWELASVLNFLSVFEPVIGGGMKLSAEEIEMGLIKPNGSLAELHISLLKGIPPVSKTLNGSDAWVTVLCKKLAMWWPWVAEGEIPLMAAKGEEISRYKDLDPTNRLLILKALCEVRADQDDMVLYINDFLKQGNQISCFRKDEMGGDGNGTSYWYDGNAIIGHRLYKEVNVYKPKTKAKGKGCLTLPVISSQWETLATNLEEFRKVVDELSCSKVAAEVVIGKTIETDAIPDLEKLQKKKERALKRKQRQEILLNDFRNPYAVGITRSCRTRRPISYTFDDYDRAIDEAIRVTKKGKSAAERRQERKGSEHVRTIDIASDGGQETDMDSKDNSDKKSDSMDSDTESDKHQEVSSDDEDEDYDNGGKKDDGNDDDSDLGDSEVDRNHKMLNSKMSNGRIALKHIGERWSNRLAGVTSHPVAETRRLGTMNRLRQRPTRNSALDSVIIPDSDDENLSENTDNGIAENTSNGIAGHESFSPVSDSQEGSDS